jgi:hypothetical protein
MLLHASNADCIAVYLLLHAPNAVCIAVYLLLHVSDTICSFDVVINPLSVCFIVSTGSGHCPDRGSDRSSAGYCWCGRQGVYLGRSYIQEIALVL